MSAANRHRAARRKLLQRQVYAVSCPGNPVLYVEAASFERALRIAEHHLWIAKAGVTRETVRTWPQKIEKVSIDAVLRDDPRVPEGPQKLDDRYEQPRRATFKPRRFRQRIR